MKISSRLKRRALIVFCTIVVLIGAAVAFGMAKRGEYLSRAVKKVQMKLHEDYSLGFQVADYKFDGLTTVVFDSVVVIPENRDTLVSMSRLGVSVRIWPLLFGEINISELDLVDGNITLIKRDSTSNYDFLFNRNKKDSVVRDGSNERNFATKVEELANQIFSKIPANMHMQNFEISYSDNHIQQKIRVPEAVIDDGDFETSLFLNDNEAEWMFKGNVDSDDQTLQLEISSKQKDVLLPFLKSKFGLAISFDKLIFDLSSIKRVKQDLLQINGVFSYENLVIDHRRISSEPVILPEARAEGGIEIASNYIALKEGSTIRVKDFILEPTVKVILKPTPVIELGVHTGLFKAQNFFDALPKGLFETIEGVEVAGDVAFNLDFSVDLDTPENIVFKSSVDDIDVKVLKWGNANIDTLNHPFEYTAYNDTILWRRIVVGPANPNFVPFNQIPNVIKTTVRTTEDPFFYNHNGFDEEAFKLSIVTNLKEKKFKRGASTISMQLIKNVFLNRKKTMNRKFEEILLVWLMEVSGDLSKDRQLEIYLNVIEWGKNVYGIEEAAQYYFGKKAVDLNLGESLYLSSIIPRPKTGLSSFDYTGHLKPWVLRHFNTYGSIMRNSGELKDVNVMDNFGFYNVLLKPSLRPKAPLIVDSIQSDVSLEDAELIQEIEVEEQAKKAILNKLQTKDI